MEFPARLTAPALLAGVLLLLLSGCARQTRQLVVLQTTDVHGFYTATDDSGSVGGLRRLAAVLDAERARGHEVLLVDSGDMWSGTLVSDRGEGRLGVAAYNLLGYDAVALGNHEFDFGPVGPLREGTDQPFGALVERLGEVKFPVLAANLIDRQSGALPAWKGLGAHTIIERGGYRIGLVGVITEDTPSITFPHVGTTLAFQDATITVIREATALRAQGVDLIFVLAHIGGVCGEWTKADDLSNCERESPVFKLVRALPPGLVDAVFGGHTHRVVAHRVAGVPVLQAGRYGEGVARLRVRDDAAGGRSVKILDPLTLDGSVDGPGAEAIGELLAPVEAEVEVLRSERLGSRIARPLDRDRHRSAALGSFVCDVLLDRFPDRQICLVNSGGLRNDLPAGDVTWGQLYDAMPFGNSVAMLEVPGSTLLEMLRIGTAGGHGVLQASGLVLTYDRGRDACPTVDRDQDGDIDVDDRDRLVRATLTDGTPVDPEQEYRLVTSSFIARGGDSMRPVIRRLHPGRVRVLADEPPVRDQVAAWLRQKRVLVNSADNPILTTPRVSALGEEPDVDCPRP